MKMIQRPIEIWWGVNTSERVFEAGIRAEEPVSILNKFLKEYGAKSHGDLPADRGIGRCPAVLDELQNVYGIKPYYDYTLNIDENNYVTSPDYDQIFFDSHIRIRSERCISFEFPITLFAPYEKSLLMSQTAPYLEDNDIANNTLIIPGQFDIAKYFRDLDHAWFFKKETSSIKFLRKQVCYYVRFHTTRPIVFRQFFWDKDLNEIIRPVLASKMHKYTSVSGAPNLSYYYKLFEKFQFKKKIIKMLEKNLTKK